MSEETKTSFTMKDLPEGERPYEKCEQLGPESLSDAELLAILVNSGLPGMKAIDVAYRLLNADERYSGLEGLVRLSLHELMHVKGIGRIKAIRLKALCELGSRISRISYRKGKCMEHADDAADYFMTSMRDLDHEELHMMMLDNAHRLLGEECITVGTVNASLIDPKAIFGKALACGALYIILAHNHPSGNLTPSSADIRATEQVRASGEIVGIELIDHLIIGNMSYTSMRAEGYLQV